VVTGARKVRSRHNPGAQFFPDPEPVVCSSVSRQTLTSLALAFLDNIDESQDVNLSLRLPFLKQDVVGKESRSVMFLAWSPHASLFIEEC